MKSVVIIQARMGSTRLPGKVMRKLCGKTVLGHVIARVRACRLIDEVVVATTTLARDDVVGEEGLRHGAKIFRGSEDDVLSRFYGAAQEAGADIVVRVTSDCPLYDPAVLDRMMEQFLSAHREGKGGDYFCNFLKRTFPRGLETEIFTFAALAQAAREAVKPYEREHVTPYFYRHPEIFSLAAIENDADLSFHRWTLDTAEDWSLIHAIYENLGRNGDGIFGMEAVLGLLAKHPELSLLNAHVEQKKVGDE